MIQDKVITITKRQVFVSYKHCQLFQDVVDVSVSIPELPVPGNLFEGEYFLPEAKRQVFSAMNHLFFVMDVTHRFMTGAQHIIIVLAIAPRNPMTAVRSIKN